MKSGYFLRFFCLVILLMAFVPAAKVGAVVPNDAPPVDFFQLPWEQGAAWVAIDGLDIGKLQGWLYSKYRIVTTPLIHPEFQGLRVTPSVYTSLDEVDTFTDRMVEAIRRGVA